MEYDNRSTGSIANPDASQRARTGEPRQQTEGRQVGAKKGSELTHVTPTGTAHMVDVGEKRTTKRVAIAHTSIRFTNNAPFRLISQNNMKKGDVLGVARIAGIMAAKKTSDLIPLCHPISITKVEVDVDLVAPGIHAASERQCAHGVIDVQALVECVGGTGVEMEALTAVSTAALTVYDMCKAVDKAMVIEGTQMVYKSGGKSGLHIQQWWADMVGSKFFSRRGLIPPPAFVPGVGPGEG